MALTKQNFPLFRCFSLVLILEHLPAQAPARYVPDEAATLSMRMRHEQWMAQHSRVYKDTAEKEKRFHIFQENVKRVESFNSGCKRPFTLGINAFSDVADEEFRAIHTGFKVQFVSRPKSSGRFRYKNVTQMPEAKDWRKDGAITPVRDQGECQCCWAFTTVAAVESLNQIKTGDLVPLSEQQLLDCDVGDQGCSGNGDLDGAFTYIQQSPGIATEEECPYEGTQKQCREPKDGGVTIAGFEDVPQGDEDTLKQAVSKQPVSIGIDGAGFEFKNYGGGIFNGGCTPDMNHAATLIGYGTDEEEAKDYWLIKNSWGESWGENGYMRIVRGKNICGIGTMATYPV